MVWSTPVQSGMLSLLLSCNVLLHVLCNITCYRFSAQHFLPHLFYLALRAYTSTFPIYHAFLISKYSQFTEQRLYIPSSEKHTALIQEHSFLLSVVCELLKGLGKWDREACGRHQLHSGLPMVGLCLSLNLSPFLVCKKGLKCLVELCPC